jgi:hypothetical protein
LRTNQQAGIWASGPLTNKVFTVFAVRSVVEFVS